MRITFTQDWQYKKNRLITLNFKRFKTYDLSLAMSQQAIHAGAAYENPVPVLDILHEEGLDGSRKIFDEQFA